MPTGVGAGVSPFVLVRTGVMATGLGGGLLGICAEGILVTLGGSAVGVSFRTFFEGAEAYPN